MNYPLVLFDAALTEQGLTTSDELYESYRSISLGWWERLEAGEVTADELRFGLGQ